ncbi:MAG: hypothetical protein WD579_03090 [Candidatus Paceibacterota bacterium]
METLAKLFGGEQKVKILRLFLFNPDEAFDNDLVKEKTRVSIATVRKLTKAFEKIGLLKKRKFRKKVKKSRGRGRKPEWKTEWVQGYVLDQSFPYLSMLHKMLVNNSPFTSKEIIKKFNNAGKIQLILVSGVFIQEWDARLDLMMVGKNLKTNSIDKTISIMESEIGKELTYAVFEESEFAYRLNVYDKLIRDVLDYPHEIIVDKMNLAGRM